ncbi:MAG: cation:proton antiporter [Xanthobacteraceae bacterium]
MLARFSLPRRTIAVLKGESLFNDALALLILGAAISLSSQAEVSRNQLSMILIAAPGGIALGIGFALVYVRIAPSFAGTLGSRLLEFVATFGVWVIAERLHLSAILCIVAFAMGVARYFPERQSARDRVHSYAVWEAAVFVLNVLAFLLMGLQARAILMGLNAAEAWQALAFAGVVLATVVLVRIAWVLLFNRAMYRGTHMAGGPDAPSFAQACIVSWCGMRGVVTLAAALYLPTDFPGRDLIVLGSLAVVLGTLIGQGLTLGPLIRFLEVQPDTSFEAEVATTRAVLLDAALDHLSGENGAAAVHLRDIYRAKRAAVAPHDSRRSAGEVDQLRRSVLDEMRTALAGIRRTGGIEDDVFQAVQEELDWAELAASSPGQLQLEET